MRRKAGHGYLLTAGIVLAALLVTTPSLSAEDAIRIETLADKAGKQYLQLATPPKLEGKPLDMLEIELPKAVSKTLEAGRLPPSWNLEIDGAKAILKGLPATDLTVPLHFRLDFSDAKLPKDLKLSALSEGRRLLQRKIAVAVLPALQKLDSLSGVLSLPPVLQPGETLIARVRSETLPGGGLWNIAGATATETGGAARVIRVAIPPSPGPSDPVSVSYQDPFGHTRVDVPEVPNCRFGPPSAGPPEEPRITGGTTHSFLGGTICVCGSFPDRCREGLSLGGIPLGPPITATGNYLLFRLPEAAYPAEHNINGSPEMGFSGDDQTGITLLQVLGSIDQKKLLRGDSTQLRLAVVGTEEQVTLDLVNHTPDIVNLEGGNQQLVEVTGSGPGGPGGQMPSPRWSEVMVHAVSPGPFNIQYTLTVPPCPCEPPLVAGPTTTTVGEPPEEPPIAPPPEYEGGLQCSPVTHKVEFEPPIQIDLRPPDPISAFPYPRPVPLQAVIRDYDTAYFNCSGCGGGISELEQPFEDRISGITWMLQGPGSLNTPFEPLDLEKRKEEIEELLKEIAEIAALIEKHKADKKRLDASRPQRRADLQKKLADLRTRLGEQEKALAEVQKRLAEIRGEIRDLERRIAEAEGAADELNDRITAKQEQREELEDLIENKPGPEETALAGRLAELQQQIETKKTELEQQRQQHTQQEEQLLQSLNSAEAALAAARERVNRLRAQIQTIQNEITALENDLYTSSLVRDLMLRKGRISRLARQIGGESSTAGRLGSLMDRFGTETNPDRRRSLLEQIREEGDRLLSELGPSCTGLPAGPERDNCSSMLDELEKEIRELTDQLEQSIDRPSATIDPDKWKRLQELRTRLADLEGQAAAAEQAQRQAEQATAEALQAYVDGLARFEEEESARVEEIRQLEDEVVQQQARLNQAIAHRQRRWAENLSSWHEQVAALRREIAGLEAARDGKLAEIEALHREGDAKKKEELAEQLKQQAAEARIKQTRSRIAATEQALRDLDTESDRLQKKIEDLEKKKEELEKQLEAKKKELEQRTTGNIVDSGQLVYYIPPPLELLLEGEDAGKFEELKEQVADRETEFEEAKAGKASLQQRAFEIIKEMAASLVALSIELEAIGGFQDEIRDLDIEKAQLGNRIAADNNRKLRDAQQRKAELEAEKKQADRKKAQAEEKEKELQEHVETEKSRLEKDNEAVESAGEQVKTRKAGHASDRERRRRLAKTIEDKKTEHERLVAGMRDVESELADAENRLSRAVGSGDEQAAARARTARNQVKVRLNNIKEAFETSRRALDDMASRLNQAVVAERTSGESVAEAERALRDAVAGRRDTYGRLLRRTYELDGARERKLAADRKVKRLEDEVGEADRKIQETQAETDKKIEDNDQVKENAAGLKKKQDELADAEKRKEDIEFDLEQLIKARDKWKEDREEADKKIEEARDNLEKARTELRAFLEEKFDTVDIKVEIKIVADDLPMDDPWRADDVEMMQPFQIRYPRKRVPEILVGAIDHPSESRHDEICIPGLAFDKAGPISKDPILPGPGPMFEPQTIALYYRLGEPLYEQWPPTEEKPEKHAGSYLMRSSASWGTGGSDEDTMGRSCDPAKAGDAIAVGVPDASSTTTGQTCAPSQGPIEPLADLVHCLWAGGTYFSGIDEPNVYLKVPDVNPKLCKDTVELQANYLDSKMQAEDDPQDKKKKYPHIPALLTEVPEVVDQFDDSGRTEIPARLFEGAHAGLPDEKIVWKVSLVAPSGLDSKSYGFEGERDKRLEKDTDGSGYSKVGFHLSERYGKLTATVEWQREDKTCEKGTIKIERLLELDLLGVGFASRLGWKEAEQLFKGGSASAEQLAGKIEAGEVETTVVIGAGLRDDREDPFEGRKLLFSPKEGTKAEVDPEEKNTNEYGIAWSFLKEVPEDSEVVLESKVEQELEPVTEPPEVEGSQPTATIKRFRIGTEAEYLVLEAVEEFVPGGEPYSKGCTLVVDGTDLPPELAALELQADGLEFAAGGSDEAPPLAVAGKVGWTGSRQFSIWGFRLTVTEIALEASVDGRIAGKLKLPKSKAEPSFTAVFGPNGFLGEFADFPEIELARFKLEEGAAVAIDFHSGKEPEPTPKSWPGNGLLIRQARLLLPKAFAGKGGGRPAISARNLIINETGVTGDVKLEYTISAAMGDMEFSIESLELNLRQNVPTGGYIEGGVKLPAPFVGSVRVTATIASGGEGFAFRVHTDNPVSAPKLGLVFSLAADTSLVYADDIFTFTLSAVVTSETFDEITIKGFMVNSKGDIKADRIAVNLDIKFGKGFAIHLETFGFKKTEDDYWLSLDCRFQFSEILKAEKVSIRIGPGPTVEDFKFKLTAKRDPVSFETTIEYRENLLKGDVKVAVEKLFDIKGQFVLGVQEVGLDESFRYWYVELAVKTAIPLGNTGLNIIELGGGLGYNYDPPIGYAPGAPRRTNDFSFKASLAVGNAPRGEVFAGRLTLVLVSGKFSINGKVWLLTKENSLYGEGQLDIYWEPESKLAGFVRMVISLPDSDGSVLRFNGQVDFLFAGSNDWYVRSRTIEGALLERVKAEGSIDVKPGSALFKGRLYYDMYKEIELSVVTVKAQVNVEARAELSIQVSKSGSTLDAYYTFRGTWDVNLDTAVKEFDIASGSLNARLTLIATQSKISVEGSVSVSWDTWVHSGSTDVDLSYEMAA